MKEVIEKIAEALYMIYDKTTDDWEHSDLKEMWIKDAQAILNLRGDCPDCGGNGLVDGLVVSPVRDASLKLKNIQCPACQGTGLSPNKMIAVLAENQELPKLVSVEGCSTIPEKFGFVEGVKAAQEIMTTPKGGMVWRKTIE